MKMNLFSKKVLPMTLAAVMAVAPVQVMAAPSSDVAGHWAEAVITEWQGMGLIKGYEDGTFKPGNNITRAEFVTIMNNALGYEDAAALSFTDVVAGNWYYNAVAKAVAAGYVSGYEDGTFKPNNTITRAEAAVMIANAMGLGDRGSVADDFTDAASIPGWAKGSIGAIVEAQYMSGYPDGSFGARKSITRAEAVSALNRVLIGGYSDDMVITEDDTVVEGGVVAGDLIIDEAVGEGEVYLNDVEVMGDLIVNGGGEDSVYLKNVKVHGKAHVNKAGVRMQMQGKTELPKVEMNAPAKLDADKTFEGEVGTVTIAKDLGTTNKVTINVPVVKLVIDAKANVQINADIKTVEIGEDAEGVKVEIAKAVKVVNMIINAIAALTGNGTIESLEVNVDDVTVNKNLTVKETEVADGVKAPTATTETTTGGGGGGSSSTSPSSKKDKVTASVDALDVAVDGYNDEDVEVKLTGATFAATVSSEDFLNTDTHYEAMLVEDIDVVAPEGIDVNPFAVGEEVEALFQAAWAGEWEGTTDVEFTVLVWACADETVAVKDGYKYTLTIPSDMLSFEKGYKKADVTVEGIVNVKESADAADLIDAVYDAIDTLYAVDEVIENEADAEGLEVGTTYVSQEAYDALQEAIYAAQEVAYKQIVTDEEVAEAMAALKEAVAAFKEAVRTVEAQKQETTTVAEFKLNFVDPVFTYNTTDKEFDITWSEDVSAYSVFDANGEELEDTAITVTVVDTKTSGTSDSEFTVTFNVSANGSSFVENIVELLVKVGQFVESQIELLTDGTIQIVKTFTAPK